MFIPANISVMYLYIRSHLPCYQRDARNMWMDRPKTDTLAGVVIPHLYHWQEAIR